MERRGGPTHRRCCLHPWSRRWCRPAASAAGSPGGWRAWSQCPLTGALRGAEETDTLTGSIPAYCCHVITSSSRKCRSRRGCLCLGSAGPPGPPGPPGPTWIPDPCGLWRTRKITEQVTDEHEAEHTHTCRHTHTHTYGHTHRHTHTPLQHFAAGQHKVIYMRCLCVMQQD